MQLALLNHYKLAPNTSLSIQQRILSLCSTCRVTFPRGNNIHRKIHDSTESAKSGVTRYTNGSVQSYYLKSILQSIVEKRDSILQNLNAENLFLNILLRTKSRKRCGVNNKKLKARIGHQNTHQSVQNKININWRKEKQSALYQHF